MRRPVGAGASMVALAGVTTGQGEAGRRNRRREPLLTRRAFLASAVAGAAALGTNRSLALGTAPRPDLGAPGRVVVAGAGLAGLTAALDLVDAGWDVVVLEARDRVGGRGHSLYDALSPRLHAEAGGESIDDNHDRLPAPVPRVRLPAARRAPDKLRPTGT